MVNPQLVNYLNQNKSRFSMDELKQALIQQGYAKNEVDQAAATAMGNAPPLVQQTMVQMSSTSRFDDPKLKETIVVFLIWGVIFYGIRYVVNLILNTFLFGYSFYFAGIIFSVIYAAIGAGLGGLMFYFIFDFVKNWIKKSNFLSRHIDSLFSLFWKPALVGFIVGVVFTLLGYITLMASPVGRLANAFSVYSGSSSLTKLLISTIIMFIVNLIISYNYAKIISNKLSKYYIW
jgi:archaellum component FlaG (FlaF/FlaG flagellin family)